MKKEDLKETKIYLSNVEDRIKFQLKMFSLGIKWIGIDGVVDYTGCPFYYIGKDFDLQYSISTEPKIFIYNNYKQIFLHDVLAIKEPKDVLAIKEPKDVCEFSPFDRVLVRDNNGARWKPKLFAFHNVDYDNVDYDKDYPFETTDGGFFRYCIPYDEDLANTTKNI